jgi:LysR family transcriptional regulator, glycine cleavage system transcriptional activator
MRKRLRHLPTLGAFVTVAELRSFSKAGEALSLTHSAVSHQIRLLEEHLGVRLLTRSPSGVELTGEGATYLTHVKTALNLLEDAEAAMRQRSESRPLRISVLPSFAGSMVVPALLQFLEQNPSIRVEIDARPGLEADELAEVDVFIRYGNGDWPGFKSIKLMDVELFPVCSPVYSERHGPFAEVSDLARVVLLRHTMEPWENWLKAVGANSDTAVQSIIPAGPQYTDARLMLVAACDGQGVALARDVLAERDIREGRLVRLFELRVPSSQGYCVYFRPDALKRASIKVFVEWLVETCARLDQARRSGLTT